MPSPSDDRITYLEARLAEQDRRVAEQDRRVAELEQARRRPRFSLPRWSLARRLTVSVLALMLALPAGVVLASHRFSDVPTSHQFHNAIAAVADAGITTGCGGTRYCPNGLVTRGQMAAFLNRMGALGPGTTPKVNADRLDDKHANQLSRVTRWHSPLSGTGLVPTAGTLRCGFRINAPAPGFITVNATVSLFVQDVGVEAHTSVWHGWPGSGAGEYSPSIPSGNYAASGVYHVPMTWVFEVVAAGENSFCVLITRGTAPVYLAGITASAMYTPYGWNGGSAVAP